MLTRRGGRDLRVVAIGRKFLRAFYQSRYVMSLVVDTASFDTLLELPSRATYYKAFILVLEKEFTIHSNYGCELRLC